MKVFGYMDKTNVESVIQKALAAYHGTMGGRPDSIELTQKAYDALLEACDVNPDSVKKFFFNQIPVEVVK